MKQRALLKGISEIIEEEVLLKINDIEFTGFANILPYDIYLNKEYDVSFTMFTDCNIKESTTRIKEIKSINDGFGYYIRGKVLKGGFLDAGIIFEDEYLKQFEYLINEYVETTVDRIDVEFL